MAFHRPQGPSLGNPAPRHCLRTTERLKQSPPMAADTTAPSSWHRTLLLTVLISLGSVLVLFPAWLPRNSGVPLEDSAVELLQLAMLTGAAAFLLAASSHAGRFRPTYRAMSFAALAAAVGEFEKVLQTFIPGNVAKFFVVPFLLVTLYYLVRYKRETLRFAALASRHPASGFIGAGLIIIYVFSRFFGSENFWQATLESNFDPDIPDICRSYLELLACYLILVGVVGFCLPVQRRTPSPAP